MKLYRTLQGQIVETNDTCYAIPKESFDSLINQENLASYLRNAVTGAMEVRAPTLEELLPPIGSQEVWGAGVTYEISREARFEESKETDAGQFYRRVYTAERPELFFKSSAFRVVGTGGKIRVRRDAHWSVPEPELTLVVNREGTLAGFTIGNDVCSRDIEGENPLYLPQGKVYDGSCALGPGILVFEDPLDGSTVIQLEIFRNGLAHFTGSTTIGKMKRTFASLIEYLYRELHFPAGAYLMTGTGVVPPNDFTLGSGDNVTITIEPIGKLTNEVE